ncbi:MAG: thiamine phosphate synthase [Candidatus Sumerlaeia bacterium]
MIARLIAITPPGFFSRHDCQSIVMQALGGGRAAIMLREKSAVSDADLFESCRWLRPLTTACGAQLIVNRRIGLARMLGADGIHLGANGPAIAEARAALGEGAVIGWSAHSVREALDAFADGADYVTLSPIYETPGKGRPLGLEPLRELTGKTQSPVIALGGIGPERIGEVMRAGAYGIAAIRSVFGRPDPAAAVARILERIGMDHF